MKKKKLSLSKKLVLKREPVLNLTEEQQAKIAGGLLPLTRWSLCCTQPIDPNCGTL